MLFIFLACSNTTPNKEASQSRSTAIPATNEQKAKKTPMSLRIYSGRSEALVGELFREAEKDLGITLNIEYGKTNDMVTRMLTEAKQSPADIIFAQDSGHLGALSNRGMLGELSDDLLSGIQEQYRDDNRKWLATSGRLRVLVYDSNKITAEELPKSLEELSTPKWKGKNWEKPP